MLAVVYAWAYQVKVVAFEVHRVVVMAIDACFSMESMWYCA